MKKLLLPPFLPILILLLIMLGSALMSGSETPIDEDDEPLRWVAFLPFALLLLYPLLLVAHGANSLIQNAQRGTRFAGVMISGGGLAAVFSFPLMVQALQEDLQLESFALSIGLAALLGSASVLLMGWWGDRIVKK